MDKTIFADIYLISVFFVFDFVSFLLTYNVSKYIYTRNLSFDSDLKFAMWLMTPLCLLEVSILIGCTLITENIIELGRMCIANIAGLLGYFTVFNVGMGRR